MRRRVTVWSAAGLAFVVALAARAEVTPRPGGGDPHIQSVLYDPQQVVGLHVAAGFATTVQFSPDERIETVTVGETSGWTVQVNRRADHVVVKPVGLPASTNLTVITDQRTYNFTLYAGGMADAAEPYTVSFVYPPPPQPAAIPASKARYRFRGERSLWPVSMSDDGKDTYIVWDADRALPAVYREDDGDQRALVNAVIKDGYYVIQGVHRRVIFISGRAQASAERIAERASK